MNDNYDPVDDDFPQPHLDDPRINDLPAVRLRDFKTKQDRIVGMHKLEKKLNKSLQEEAFLYRNRYNFDLQDNNPADPFENWDGADEEQA